MTHPLTRSPADWPRRPPAPARAFTLVELLLVLTLLLTVLGFAAPTLAWFFRGRELDSETLRFLALTRYGQTRAVDEGVPMVLWMDPEQRRYGLEAESTYLELDDQAREFELAEGLEIEVNQPRLPAMQAVPIPTLAPLSPALDSQRPRSLQDLYWLRFTPDGSLGESGPDWIAFHQVREGKIKASLWVAPSRNRMRYEIWTNQPPLLRR